jgi:hypothetical protein
MPSKETLESAVQSLRTVVPENCSLTMEIACADVPVPQSITTTHTPTNHFILVIIFDLPENIFRFINTLRSCCFKPVQSESR